MSSPFVGQILVVGFNFAPKGFAACDGQLIPISQNTALFSLLGTFYGGNGVSTFALPNLQGCLSVGQGQLAGGQQYSLGESSGSPAVALLNSEMPSHTHLILADNLDPADSKSVTNAALSGPPNLYTTATSPLVQMNPSGFPPAGASAPHNNMMPYLCLNFVIAMQGVFPARQ